MPRKIRPIRIEGKFAYVTLTQGYEAVIDAVNADWIGQWNWCACVNKKTVYAKRRIASCSKTIYMHRLVAEAREGQIVDHVDCNGLNNTTANIRIATFAENNRNQSLRITNTSGIKGVRWRDDNRKWEARIKINKKEHHLGYYDKSEEAHAAYCEASDRLHGEFGRTQ
jgi:hypothetical protein